LIADWANNWQLSVSVDKCSVLKIGCGTAVDADFILSGNVLPTVTHCRDLGVTIVSDLSSTQYISEIVSKAHQTANCIVRSFSSGDMHLLVRAYIVYVRPIVENNNVIWSTVAKYCPAPLKLRPYGAIQICLLLLLLKHNIELAEKVQRRFAKRLHELCNLSYCDRLTKLGLCTLELCRLHLDLSYCYNIVFGLVNVNFDDFFALSTNTNTRGS